jgi:hypothetical protein
MALWSNTCERRKQIQLFLIETAPYQREATGEQDILPSAFALTAYIEFALIISFLVINSRAMGSISRNHGDRHIGIENVKDWLMGRLGMIYIARKMVFDQGTVYWTIYIIECHAEQDSGSWEGPSISGRLSWSAADSSIASTPVSFSRIRRPNILRIIM